MTAQAASDTLGTDPDPMGHPTPIPPQAELAKLLEANGRLQRKVEACEHNIDETRDAAFLFAPLTI